METQNQNRTTDNTARRNLSNPKSDNNINGHMQNKSITIMLLNYKDHANLNLKLKERPEPSNK